MAIRTKRTRAPRKPHNARREDYQTFDELLAKIGDEPCQAMVDDEEVTMTQIERLLRVMIDRAMHGNVREMTKLLQIMPNDPGLAATSRTQTVIFYSKLLADV